MNDDNVNAENNDNAESDFWARGPLSPEDEWLLGHLECAYEEHGGVVCLADELERLAA